MRMNIYRLLVLVFCVSLNGANAQQQNKNADTKISASLELPRIQVVPIQDTQNDRQYELLIKLPEEYSDTTKSRYPVIYYTDAMWHVELLSGAADYLMEDAILVGISWQKDISAALLDEHGTHVSRYRDYSILPSEKPEIQEKYQLGQADRHLSFIRKDVFRYVEENYHTDPANRTYFGYSMGGEFGTFVLISKPETFNNYILGSPSLNREIPYLKKLLASQDRPMIANVMITYGSLEDELGTHVEKLVDLLKNRNDQRLALNPVIIDGSHQTAFPSTAVQGVKWLSNLGKD